MAALRRCLRVREPENALALQLRWPLKAAYTPMAQATRAHNVAPTRSARRFPARVGRRAVLFLVWFVPLREGVRVRARRQDVSPAVRKSSYKVVQLYS